MEKYTWNDVIINPNSEQAKACIGKEVYCADSPHYCLEKANGNEVDNTVYILQKILPDNNYPFRLGENAEYEHCCIIPKKEESKPEPKYVPFKNSGESISEFEDNTPIMHIYGLWIYEKIGKFDERVPRLVTEMWGDGVVIGSDKDTTTWKELLKRFVFENNVPCGKLQEEN